MATCTVTGIDIPECSCAACHDGLMARRAVSRPKARPPTRPSASDRGYDYRWSKRSKRFTKGKACASPHPDTCTHVAAIADHYPRSRKQLLADGVVDPDEDCYLRALCKPCHDRETAKHQPGGWMRRPSRLRKAERHPGMP